MVVAVVVVRGRGSFVVVVRDDISGGARIPPRRVIGYFTESIRQSEAKTKYSHACTCRIPGYLIPCI